MAATFLASEGVPVRVDSQYTIMHDKFIVVDGATVEEGSFNYTAAAENRNEENVLALPDSTVAPNHNKESERLCTDAETLKRRY